MYDLFSHMSDANLRDLAKALALELSRRDMVYVSLPELDSDEKAAVLEGRMVFAIKLYRVRTGANLNDALRKCRDYRDSL